MVTDLETTKTMLDKAGVVYAEEVPPGNGTVVELRMGQGDSPQNLGYPEFVAVLGFDIADGSLRWVGAWE